MTKRLVVIGGDAAGMSAASQARRRAGDDLEVVVLERGRFTSYSACGIPYWVAGDVTGPEALVARTPEEHRRRGIDVRLGVEATALDLDAGRVETRDVQDGRAGRVEYDELLIATGAVPLRPPVPGVDALGVHGVQTLDDGCALLDRLESESAGEHRAVVVGAGYIGIEMAEAMLRRGYTVTVVDRLPEPMATLDPDMGRLVHKAMEGMGIQVVTGTSVDGFDTDRSGNVRAVFAGGSTFPADLVVLGAGVRPHSELAQAAGMPTGRSGGIRVDETMAIGGRTSGLWAAGDCVESFDRVSRSFVHVPLGTHANKQGRVAGINIAGGDASFPGIVRTAVSKVCDLEVGRTGLLEREADDAGLDYVTATVESTTRAGYFPGTRPLTVKMLAERGSGRLLGAQIVGREGAAKRIDVCALALWNGMTVGELAMTDLSYAPPFSPVWDPVLITARKAAEALGH